MKRGIPVLLSVLLILLMLLSGCGSLNKAENLAIYKASELSQYTIAEDKRLYAPVESPWLLIRCEPSHDGDVPTDILAVSDDLSRENFSDELLAKISTLVVCTVREFSTDYKSTTTGFVSSGSGESGDICYYHVDHSAKTLIRYDGSDEVMVKMPEKSTGTPHLKVSVKEIVSTVKKRVESGVCPLHDMNYFVISKQGELVGANYDGDAEQTNPKLIVVIPPSVKSIAGYCLFFGGFAKNNKKTATAFIPATVEEIGRGAFCYDSALFKSERFRLVVEPGSCAERYAIEQGLEYMYYEDYYNSESQ